MNKRIKKTIRMAKENNVEINAYVDDIDETIFEDNSNGIPHFHCMDTIICEKVI